MMKFPLITLRINTPKYWSEEKLDNLWMNMLDYNLQMRGTVCAVHPSNTECCYLRMISYHVRGTKLLVRILKLSKGLFIQISMERNLLYLGKNLSRTLSALAWPFYKLLKRFQDILEIFCFDLFIFFVMFQIPFRIAVYIKKYGHRWLSIWIV